MTSKGRPMTLDDVIRKFTDVKRVPVPVPDMDAIPSIRDPEPGTDFMPPNPDIPARIPHDSDILELLENIERNTRASVPSSPGVVWEQRFQRLPAAAGEVSVIASERVRYIYLPNVPRPMRIYTGSSYGTFLASLTANQSMQVELPYQTNGVYLVYDAGTANDQVNVYFSSRKIDIDVW